MSDSKKIKLIAILAKGALITFTVLTVLYSIFWFSSLYMLSQSINDKYANRNLNIINADSKYGYFLKFTKVVPTGFPFKFAIKINNWQEESRSSNIIYHSPVSIGYDLIKQHLFLHFSGDLNAWYKPSNSGFGTKISKENFYIHLSMPLAYDLIKILIDKRDLFQLVNFIKKLDYGSKKVKIFDVSDNNKLLYDADFENLTVKFEQTKFYENIADFLNNIPQKLEITHKAKLNHAIGYQKLSPENLLHSYLLPFPISGTTKILVTTEAQNINDIAKNITLSLQYNPDDIMKYIFDSSLLYHHKIYNNNDMNLDVKLSTGTITTSGYFAKLSKAMKNTIYANQNLDPLLKKIFGSFVDIYDKLDLQPLENKKYNLVLDVNSGRNANNIYIKVNNFQLSSGSSSISFKNDAIIKNDNLFSSYDKGDLILHNYDKLVEFIASNIHILKYTQDNDIITKKLYTDICKDFVKRISDHPNSNSNDLSFEYVWDSSDNNGTKSKIGSISFNKLLPNYYLSLYQNVVKHTQSKDEVLKAIKILAPQLNDNMLSLLEQLIVKTIKIDDKVWQELIE